jgi:hypothetical protein
MEEADMVELLNNNMVAIPSKEATRNKVILNKATSKVTAVVPDMVEDMAVVVDTEVVINSSLLRSPVVSVPEVPRPSVLVVV